MSIDLKRLEHIKKINPPKWLLDNIHYLTISGSFAYGTNTKESDYDIYGICIPPKNILFPWLENNKIFGFDSFNAFEQWNEQHIRDEDSKKEYDFTVYNITRFFYLCANANPNVNELLYTPQDCVLICSSIGQMIRENRQLFLSKKAWHTHKGYSYSALHSMMNKQPIGKRVKLIQKYSFDVKHASNVVRLLYQIEQILNEEDLDLRRHKDHLKAIRNGEATEKQIKDFFTTKEKELEKLYHSSKLRYEPALNEIRQLLINCLEHHYGSLEKCYQKEKESNLAEKTLSQIDDLLNKYYNG